MRISTIQASFVSGELADDVGGRRDTPQLRNAARVLLNCWPRAAGGAVSRPGFYHLAYPPGSQLTRVRLYAFTGSNGRLYLACFYSSGSDIRVQFYLFDPAPEPNGTLLPTLTTCGPPIEVSATVSTIELLRVATAFDTMFVVHPDNPPRVLRRTGTTSFFLSPYVIEAGSVAKWAFYRYAPQGVLIRCTAVKGPGPRAVVTTAPAFQAAQVGNAFRIFDTTTRLWVHATMTAFASPTNATFNFEAPGLTQNVDMPVWEEQAWSALRGWPRTVCLFEQRLVIGGARDAPDAVWLSRTGAYFNFDQGVGADAEGIGVVLSNSGDGEIRHVFGGRYLLVLSANRARYFDTASGRPIAPSNIVPRVIGDFGAWHAEPVVLDDGVFYWQSDRVTLRRLSFDGVELERRVRSEPANVAAPDMEIADSQFSVAALQGSRYGPEDVLLSPTRAEEFMFEADGFDYRHMAVLRSGESGRQMQFGRWTLGHARAPSGRVHAAAAGDGFLFVVVSRIESVPGDTGAPVMALEVLHPQMWGAPLDAARGTTAVSMAQDTQTNGVSISAGTFYLMNEREERLISTYTPVAGLITWIVPDSELGGRFFIGVPFVWGVGAFPVKLDAPTGPADARRLRVSRAGVLSRPFDPVRIEGADRFATEVPAVREMQPLLDGNGLVIVDGDGLPIIGTVLVASRQEHVWRRTRLVGWQQDGAVRLRREDGKPWHPVSVLSLEREVSM